MEILNMLIEYFGLNYTATNFGEFLPWFCKLILAVFLVCFVFRCLFSAVHKIVHDLR